jgi:hypothetical protein
VSLSSFQKLFSGRIISVLKANEARIRERYCLHDHKSELQPFAYGRSFVPDIVESPTQTESSEELLNGCDVRTLLDTHRIKEKDRTCFFVTVSILSSCSVVMYEPQPTK